MKLNKLCARYKPRESGDKFEIDGKKMDDYTNANFVRNADLYLLKYLRGVASRGGCRKTFERPISEGSPRIHGSLHSRDSRDRGDLQNDPDPSWRGSDGKPN